MMIKLIDIALFVLQHLVNKIVDAMKALKNCKLAVYNKQVEAIEEAIYKAKEARIALTDHIEWLEFEKKEVKKNINLLTH